MMLIDTFKTSVYCGNLCETESTWKYAKCQQQNTNTLKVIRLNKVCRNGFFL